MSDNEGGERASSATSELSDKLGPGTDSSHQLTPDLPVRAYSAGSVNLDPSFTVESLLAPLDECGMEFEGKHFMRGVLERLGNYMQSHLDDVQGYKIGYTTAPSDGTVIFRFTFAGDFRTLDHVVPKVHEIVDEDIAPMELSDKDYRYGQVHINRYDAHFTVRVYPDAKVVDATLARVRKKLKAGENVYGGKETH